MNLHTIEKLKKCLIAASLFVYVALPRNSKQLFFVLAVYGRNVFSILTQHPAAGLNPTHPPEYRCSSRERLALALPLFHSSATSLASLLFAGLIVHASLLAET